MADMNETTTDSPAGFQEILEMIVRKRVLFFIPFAAIFLLSLGVGLLLPRVYQASSLIKVGNRQIIEPIVRDIAVSPNLQEEINTLSQQLMSWPKLEQLVTQLRLAPPDAAPLEREDLITSIRKRITVRIRNNDIIEIVYQDRSPAHAQQVVNALTQNLIEENARIKKQEARNAIDFISEQLAIYRRKLENSQENFSANKIESDLRNAYNRKTLLKERMTSIQRIIPSQVTTEQNPVVRQLQAYLGQLETSLTQLMRDAKATNPRIGELKKEIAGVQERINAEMEKDTVKESISTFNPLYLQTEQELKQAELEIAYLEKRRRELEKGGPALKTVSEEELPNLERNKQVDEDIYQMLLRQLETAYVSERLQDSEKGAQFTVIEYARLPLSPVKPKMSKVAAMGFFGGIAAGFGFVFLLETLARSFNSPEQAKEALALPHLGSISRIILEDEMRKTPLTEIRDKFDRFVQKHQALSKIKFVPPHVARRVLNSGVSPAAVVYHEPKSKISEEFRVVRTALNHGIGENGAAKVFVVTSTLRGEGKSTTSANLAIAYADSGKRTLLVDADLRKGSLGNVFSLSACRGLSDILAGAASADGALLPSPVKNLSLLMNGVKTDKPSELLDSPAMRELIGTLRSRFDAVILDAPPVLNLPDPCILSKYGDAVILVIQAGRAKRHDVAGAQAILRQVDAKIAGFVMTNVQYYMPRYMYDYYYE